MAKAAMSKRQRGTSLIEVLAATIVLTLAFLFVSGDMIASTQAEKTAADRSIAISMAGYFIDSMRQDSTFWLEQTGGVWSSPPPGNDPCGNAWPPYNDNPVSPTWHAVPTCVSAPFANAASHGTYQYMWQAQEQSDPNAANLTVWIQTNTLDDNGTAEVFEINQLNRNDPLPNSSGLVPPSPSASPSPSGSPSHSPSPTPTPSHTPTPSPTPTPSHTPTPSPTPSPSPTVIQ